jgi:hypothetical protein
LAADLTAFESKDSCFLSKFPNEICERLKRRIKIVSVCSFKLAQYVLGRHKGQLAIAFVFQPKHFSSDQGEERLGIELRISCSFLSKLANWEVDIARVVQP